MGISLLSAEMARARRSAGKRRGGDKLMTTLYIIGTFSMGFTTCLHLDQASLDGHKQSPSCS